MDRPTTGKRHVRSGAVPVSELIGRQSRPADDIVTVTRVDAAPRRQAPSRAATLAKIAVLSVATATLVGAVAAATFIARQRDTTSTDPGARPITGERALLPDELNRAVTESTGMPAQSTGSAAATITERVDRAPVFLPTQRTSSPVPTVDQPTTAEPPGPTRPNRDQDESDKKAKKGKEKKASHREIVLEYYRLVESSPSGAFDLIAGFDTTLSQFLSAWSSVGRVQVVDVTERQDGVVAVVGMTLADGGALRIEQLLTVADTVPQRIVAAELLSAQVS